MPNKVVQTVDSYEPEQDDALEFQDKVLSCLSDISMYNSIIMDKSQAVERSIKEFRSYIHGEDIDR
jgi:hypothetical protein